MALDAFMELVRGDDTKVEGESLDQKFPKTIAIESFEIKTEDSGKKSDSDSKEGKEGKEKSDKSAKSKGKLKCPVSFKVTKHVDSSSPALYLSYCLHSDQEDENDTPFKMVRVTLRKSDSSNALTYLVFSFAEAFVTSYSIESDTEKLPSESVKFTCKKCCVTYRPQRVDGGGKDTFGGWDFVQGASWEPTKGG